MESPTLIARELNAEAAVFGFLAQVFSSHPTEGAMRSLSEMASEIGIACPRDLAAHEVDQEYMDLFVIPGPRYIAPYESVFRDKWILPAVLKRGSNPGETGETIKGLLMGESTLNVRQYYLDAGLLPEEELPDHISNELRFLAYLCAREAIATANEACVLADIRERFRQEHVLKWIGELRQKIGERERLGYYRTAVEVAEVVLGGEAGPAEPERRAAIPVPQPSRCPFHHG